MELTEDFAIESFIELCYDLDIVTEALININKIKEALKKFLIKIRHIIKRMTYTLLKFKKITISKQKHLSLMTVETNLCKLITSYIGNYKFDTSGEEGLEKANNELTNIINSSAYKDAFTKLSVINEKYDEIDSSKIVVSLKSMDKRLEDFEKDMVSCLKDSEYYALSLKYNQFGIRLFTTIINVLMQYFVNGKAFNNKTGEIIDLGKEYNVEPDAPTNY